jgi:hypothetical protein
MNNVASMTIAALRHYRVPELPVYDRALAAACDAFPPPYGFSRCGELYIIAAQDIEYVKAALVSTAQSEGQGARALWDMAACTPDTAIARQLQQHAIEESRHSELYLQLVRLLFGGERPGSLSPRYTVDTPLVAEQGSPYAYGHRDEQSSEHRRNPHEYMS